jgi:methanogenic corrinoid protein MtbC1
LGFLLEFLETTHRRILDPVAIGLEPNGRLMERNSTSELDSEATIARFEKALLMGSEPECRKIISSWFSTQGGMCSLADDLLSPTFRSIGKLWKNGTIDIYQERLACEICHRIVLELRWLLPEPSVTAPLAMGGTPSGDPYQLATLLTEMVFREQGWRTAGLGSNIPFPSLLSAARKHMPKIFWISVSHIEDEKTFLAAYSDFAMRLPKGIVLVVGGRAFTDELRPKMMYSAHCDGMRQLTTLAKALKTGSLPLAP